MRDSVRNSRVNQTIGLLGRGRMGKVVQTLMNERELKLVGPIGQGGEFDSLSSCDVVIDFSLPAGVLTFIEKLGTLEKPPALVVASTGWKLEERKLLEAYSKKTPLLVSSNFSMGVLALMEILKTAAPLLEKLGYNPVITETHHTHKKDFPSGTALSLQRVIAPSGPGNVQTHSVRAGEIVGDHEVSFYGPADHLTFGHFAQDRSVFARGAIEAALWLATKRAAGVTGIASMEAFFRERTSV
jgi:4-hydroxy-tetrahydrodipicolinate reductase